MFLYLMHHIPQKMIFNRGLRVSKIRAVEAGISEKLLNDIMLDVRFLPK